MADGHSRVDRSPPHAEARLAGLLYAIVVVSGVFSLSHAANKVFAGESGSALMQSINANEALLRALIASELVCYTAFLAVALALYRLLEHAGQFAAMLMTGLAVSSVPFGYANIAHLLEILRALDAGGAQSGEIIIAAYQRYQSGLFLQSAPWGLWLIPFGYLVFRSGFLPRILGILLILAGLGYAANLFGRLLIERYDPGVLGQMFRVLRMAEIAVTIWLLLFGARRTLAPRKHDASQEHVA